MKPCCSYCGSENVYGISRVVGYYSPINNWNLSKQAELDDRQKGDYKLTKESNERFIGQSSVEKVSSNTGSCNAFAVRCDQSTNT